MAVRQRRHSKEELARRGQELYESGIRQQVEAENEGKIVAIDIETGEFEVNETLMGQPIGSLNVNPMLSLGPFGLDIVRSIILEREA
nr:hypothetical protein [Acaryochloris sp. CCMEE 5410]